MGDQKITKEILQQELDFFVNNRDQVKKCNDFYDGGISVTQGNYIYQMLTEADDVYAKRVERAYNDNIIYAPIKTLADFMFAGKNVKRTPGAIMGEEIPQMFDNIDGAGANANDFFKEVFKNKFTEGVFLILSEPSIRIDEIDSENGNFPVITKDDVVNNPPVLKIIKFENLCDNTFDSNGLPSFFQ